MIIIKGDLTGRYSLNGGLYITDVELTLWRYYLSKFLQRGCDMKIYLMTDLEGVAWDSKRLL